MVTRIGTQQRKTRHKFKRNYRERGKMSLSRYFYQFEQGDKVALKIFSAIQKGRFFPRFHGKIGTIVGKRGFCYKVKITDGSKEKNLFIHPIHLKNIKLRI